MDSNIVNSEAARLAREIAGYSHKPVEEVIEQAVRDLADRVLPRAARSVHSDGRSLVDRVREIQDRVSKLPVLDHRTPEEIIGYDEHGLPPQ